MYQGPSHKDAVPLLRSHMQPLVYKAGIMVEQIPSWLAPGMEVHLEPMKDGRIAVIATRPKRWSWLPSTHRRTKIGRLTDEVGEILHPTLFAPYPLRVRVVEVVPRHLGPEGWPLISISIWGVPEALTYPMPGSP